MKLNVHSEGTWKFSTSALILSTVTFGCSGDVTETGKRPNIVIVLADDLGWGDVGYHGSHIQTPNLDRLAETAVRLNRFYVAPVSTPTRAGLLTGRYPNRMGVRHVVIPPWRDYGIEPDEIFLPQELEKVGYKHRAIIGKWHLGHSRKKYYPLNRGFTHFYGHLNGAIDFFSLEREGELDWHDDWESSYDKGYSTDLITEHAVRCIKDYSGEKDPFFIYVAYNAPHTPLQAKDEDLELYGFDPSEPRFGQGDKTGRGNNKEQTFAAMVTCMDRGIGQIIRTLKDMDEFENTIFLFFSDNGTDNGSSGELRGRKFLEFEGGVRVPALLSWPAGLQGERTIDQVTGYVDVMPTLLDVLGLQSTAEFDGMSMLPVLTGEKAVIERNLYLGLGAVVSNEWKFIEKGHNPAMEMKSDMLFKIDADPSEQNNLMDTYKEKAEEFRSFVKTYDTIQPPRPLPDYGMGRDGFVAPEEWKVTGN
ncbi:arylsulfatase [uncultured Proteiniphilum sp.]|uniref:arylsulfatase B n=1 Tax=uncultured Proteiniphilum sp. TaxID=497637 RepID=UPI002603412D|nr:arylsulfatase [uncultured Proteiniphilum sp.]